MKMYFCLNSDLLCAALPQRWDNRLLISGVVAGGTGPQISCTARERGGGEEVREMGICPCERFKTKMTVWAVLRLDPAQIVVTYSHAPLPPCCIGSEQCSSGLLVTSLNLYSYSHCWQQLKVHGSHKS